MCHPNRDACLNNKLTRLKLFTEIVYDKFRAKASVWPFKTHTPIKVYRYNMANLRYRYTFEGAVGVG